MLGVGRRKEGFMEHVPVIHPRVNLMVSGRRLLEYITEDYIHLKFLQKYCDYKNHLSS